jgi:DNA-binding beta-propeller fold protein YncE
MRRRVLVVGVALLAAFTGGVAAMRSAVASPVLHTVAMGARPVAAAVDERTGRAFVMGPTGVNLIGPTGVSLLDARTDARLGFVTLSMSPALGGQNAAAVDERTGQVFVTMIAAFTSKGLTDASPVLMFDGRTGRLLCAITVGLNPTAVAVDAGTNRVFVTTANMHLFFPADSPGADGGSASGTWGWASQWLQQWLSGLPWLPHQSMDNDSANGSVSVLDVTR